MKKSLYLLLIIILFSLPLSAQVAVDSLSLDWGATVNYGSFGQRTVLVNDTLWHFGGRFFYGTPFGAQSYEQSFVEYRALTDSYWEVDATTTLYRYYGNAHAYDGKVYLLGGGGYDPLAVEVFDPATRSVTLLEPMPAQHRSGGSVLHNGKIYMVAGSDDAGHTNRVDIYEIATNSWSTGANHPNTAQTEAVVHGDMIYTMGGYDGTTRDEIYTYDITNDNWSLLGTMPYPTSAHRMELYNDEIFVISDYAALDRLMKYSISDSSWVEYESNFIGRRHGSTVIADNKLYIIAGNANLNGYWQYFNLTQSFDLSSVVSVAQEPSVQPTRVQLKQNYPNPFNPTTSIRFFLEQANNVELTIYNLKGQKVRQLHRAKLSLGEHEVMWDGRSDSGKELPSGQYMYALKTGDNVMSKKMVLLR